MSPDENYLEKQAKEEEEKLHRKIKGLSDADKTDIYEKGNDNAVASFFVWLLLSSSRSAATLHVEKTSYLALCLQPGKRKAK